MPEFSQRIYGLNTDGSPNPSMDISALTVFRPTMNKCVLQPDTEEDEDEFGVTTMTRKWKCRRDLARQFRPRWGDLDFQYERLKVVRHRVLHDGAVCTFVVTYNGFVERPGEPRVIESGPVFEEREVPLQPIFTDAASRTQFAEVSGGGQITMQYIAPTAVLEYATEERPQPGTLYTSNHALYDVSGIQVMGYRIGGSTILATGSNAIIQTLYKFDLKGIRTVFDPKPDGHVFRVREVVELRPVQEIWIGAVGR